MTFPAISEAESTLRREARETVLNMIKAASTYVSEGDAGAIRALAEAYALVVGSKS